MTTDGIALILRAPSLRLKAGLLLLATLLLTVLVEFKILRFSLNFAFLFLVMSIWINLHFIRRLPSRGYNFFDPALILIVYLIVVLIPVCLLAISDFSLLQISFYQRFIDVGILTETVNAHLIFVCSLGFTYTFLCVTRSKRMREGSISHSFQINPLAKSSIWIFLAIWVFLFHLYLQYELGLINPWSRGGTQVLSQAISAIGMLEGQFYQKFIILEQVLLIFGIGVYAARAPTLQKARIRLFMILIIVVAIKFSLTTERGIVVLVGLGAAAYADSVRWRGDLLNSKLVFFGILFGLLFDMTTTMIENRVLYSNAGALDIVDVMTINSGVASVWVTSTIINWIETGNISLQYGQNYLNALTAIVPSQIRGFQISSLPNWFAYLLAPAAAERGVGYGFSPVAEGYLNGRLIGVFLHGMLVGGLLTLIRKVQYLPSLKGYGVFFFAILYSGVFKIFHVGSINITETIQWEIIIVLLTLLVAGLLLEYCSLQADGNLKLGRKLNER